ncbi:hypothetical protein M5K25_027471 [Dendrobium thyrsiflorum]|uniref:Uncharacterized protein n=1 Tax=Dendrobium thyrsiflorum TaxID=117978 RepID=A0ABD0TTX6_DENTH
MADPEQDHGFVVIDIIKLLFFDVNPEVDQTVEDYVDKIIFSLAAAIKDQLSPVQWQSWTSRRPVPNTLVTTKILGLPTDPQLFGSTPIHYPTDLGKRTNLPPHIPLGPTQERSAFDARDLREDFSPITSPKSEVSCFISFLLCMADPEQDHRFVYNDQGQIDIIKSPFFDVNPEVDQTVEDYVDRIIFSLAAAIEDQLSLVQWQGWIMDAKMGVDLITHYDRERSKK